MSSGVQTSVKTEPRGLYDRQNRYADNWRSGFADRYAPYLKEDMTILDVGSGRTPAMPLGRRPAGCTYIGLDISAAELAAAPVGAYGQEFAVDLRQEVPGLVGKVDLAISWQVLEHIAPLSVALENVHAYLKPGGHFVALLSGRNAHFAIVNRAIPEKLGVFGMKTLLNRPPDTVFRANYDSCTFSGLTKIFDEWTEMTVFPFYRGADYLQFSKILANMYLRFEDWAANSEKKNLATHYIVVASR